MSFFKWSRTAANNATADSTCPFPEGMAPSALNDGTRGMMAAAAKYRDDIAGAIVTGGTSTAYTVGSYEGFGSFADLNGQMIAFTPHATNGANGSSLNVDGLGVKPILPAPGVGLPGGVLIQGTPYAVTYNNTDGVFYLHGLFGNPYNIPLGGGIDYWGSTAPNASFAFPTGQAISRATYSGLFSLIGTTFGAGDGSTTFNLPDKRGRVSAAWDAMGGSGAGIFTPAFGGKIGEQNHTLLVGELPAHTHSGTTGNDSPDHTHVSPTFQQAVQTVSAGAGAAFSGTNTPNQITSGASARHTHPFTTDGGTGGGAAHNVTQPTIVCNYILRII